MLPFETVNAVLLRDFTARTLKILNISNGSISVIVTDDTIITEINRDYRDRDYPTDVIAFEYRDNTFPRPAEEEEELGDIYLSLETAKRQAAEYGVTLREETARLVVHGILHCAGYDHEDSEEDGEIMALKEEEILGKIL